MKSLVLLCVEVIANKDVIYENDEIDDVSNKLIELFKRNCNNWHKVLFYGAINGYLDIVKFMFQHDTDFHIENENTLQLDYTFCSSKSRAWGCEATPAQGGKASRALQLAAQEGHLEVIRFLVEEHKPDINANNGMALRRASENNHIEVVEYLLSIGCIDYYNARSRMHAFARRYNTISHSQEFIYRNMKPPPWWSSSSLSYSN